MKWQAVAPRISFAGEGFYYRASAFVVAILGIIRKCSKEKMVWPNTQRNIAFMENAQTFRYRTSIENPRNAMGTHQSFAAPTGLHLTVSTKGFTTFPQPTSFSLSYFLPKTLCQWLLDGMIGVIARTTAKLPNIGAVRFKHFPASYANLHSDRMPQWQYL